MLKDPPRSINATERQQHIQDERRIAKPEAFVGVWAGINFVRRVQLQVCHRKIEKTLSARIVDRHLREGLHRDTPRWMSTHRRPLLRLELVVNRGANFQRMRPESAHLE